MVTGVDIGGRRQQPQILHVGLNGGGGGSGSGGSGSSGGGGRGGAHGWRGGAVTARRRGQARLVHDVALRHGHGHRFRAVVAVVAAVVGHHVCNEAKQTIHSIINFVYYLHQLQSIN